MTKKQFTRLILKDYITLLVIIFNTIATGTLLYIFFQAPHTITFLATVLWMMITVYTVLIAFQKYIRLWKKNFQ